MTSPYLNRPLRSLEQAMRDLADRTRTLLTKVAGGAYIVPRPLKEEARAILEAMGHDPRPETDQAIYGRNEP